ncbi:hypothetical protein GWI33_012785 [Rhynchophorus ferrugineus]|uniref:Uncharacterized protein n=1 Tax=Rhynchophorus ferrugineus TaxID=354439 RepID=A0A834I4Z8_RHYFE|nr:hypothetical protein GWI33_012785 [Rhynchophorus ferrugineus]
MYKCATNLLLRQSSSFTFHIFLNEFEQKNVSVSQTERKETVISQKASLYLTRIRKEKTPSLLGRATDGKKCGLSAGPAFRKISSAPRGPAAGGGGGVGSGLRSHSA